MAGSVAQIEQNEPSEQQVHRHVHRAPDAKKPPRPVGRGRATLCVVRIGLVLVSFAAFVLSAGSASGDGPPIPPGYEQAVSRLPAGHWALVRAAHADRPEGGQANRKRMEIRLPPGGSDGDLYHEVGHIVAWAHPEVAAAWRETFWPGGEIIGTPSSSYGRTSPGEDFAEAYQQLLEQGRITDPRRDAFMRERVLGRRPIPEPRPAMRPIAPCGSLPSGSVVSGCSAVPSGSVSR